MPTLIFEMKIIKYAFKTPKLKVVNNELIEEGYVSDTCTFTLLNKGVGLYEELNDGEPLMATLSKFKGNDEEISRFLLTSDFIPNLACASYVKIDGDKFHNNRATAEEFKKKAFFGKITEDIEFVRKLVEMAMDCMIATKVSKSDKNKDDKKGDKTPKK